MQVEAEGAAEKAASQTDAFKDWFASHGFSHYAVPFELRNGDVIEFFDAKSNVTEAAQLHMVYPNSESRAAEQSSAQLP